MCSRRRSSRPSCSTSSPWLRPSSERSSGSSPFAGSDALRRSRQLPPGRRRWPSASAARAGRGGRRLLSPLQDGRAGCAAVRSRLQHVGLWRGTRMTWSGLRKESLGRGRARGHDSCFLVSASHNVRYECTLVPACILHFLDVTSSRRRGVGGRGVCPSFGVCGLWCMRTCAPYFFRRGRYPPPRTP